MTPRAKPLTGREPLDWRYRGAWLGQAIGLALGLPVAGWTRRRARETLEAAGAYPIVDYLPASVAGDRVLPWAPLCSFCRGGVQCVEPHESLAYQVAALMVAERAGAELTSRDLLGGWLLMIPRDRIGGAMERAIANHESGMLPPMTARRFNPYREDCEALRRAGVWGLACPGDAWKAAELAARSASISHVRNGVYAAMFVAAATARACLETDLRMVVEAAAACVPPRSRLAEAIQRTRDWADATKNWEETANRIDGQYESYPPAHAVPGLARVVAALLHGACDFGATVGLAAASGGPADAVAQAAGSIAGALVGTAGIPDRLRTPLNAKFRTCVTGQEELGLSDLVRRTFLAASRFNEAIKPERA